MCLIIVRDRGVVLDKEAFETAVLNNPDGWGLSVPDMGKLYTIKEVDGNGTDAGKLYDLIHTEFAQDKLMLHLRYTTAGDTTLRNAHPFPITEYDTHGLDIRMAHNGTLSKYKPSTTDKNKWESDTRVFARTYVRPLMDRMIRVFGDEVLSDDFTRDILEDQLSASSVLCFIDGYGNTMYVNELGNGGLFDDDGTYYSNSYSFNPTYRTSYGGTVLHNNKSGTKKQEYGQNYGDGYYQNGYLDPVTGVFTSYDDWCHEKTEQRQKDVTTKHIPTKEEKEKGMSDTQVDKFSDVFSKKYGLDGLQDMFTVSDETIAAMLKVDDNSAELFIKEMLAHAFDLYQTNAHLKKQLKAEENTRKRTEATLYDANMRIASQSKWITEAKENGYNGKAA